MFNPEFRYLINQEEQNNQMMDLDYIFAGGMIVCVNMIGIVVIGSLAYKILEYGVIFTKELVKSIWDTITPANEWLEVILIVTSIASAAILFLSLKGIGDLLDNSLTKMKNLLMEKDTQIKKLEEKLRIYEEKYDLNRLNKEYEKYERRLEEMKSKGIIKDQINNNLIDLNKYKKGKGPLLACQLSIKLFIEDMTNDIIQRKYAEEIYKWLGNITNPIEDLSFVSYNKSLFILVVLQKYEVDRKDVNIFEDYLLALKSLLFQTYLKGVIEEL